MTTDPKDQKMGSYSADPTVLKGNEGPEPSAGWREIIARWYDPGPVWIDSYLLEGRRRQAYARADELLALLSASPPPPEVQPVWRAVELTEEMVEAGCRAMHEEQGSGDADEPMHSPYQKSWDEPDSVRWRQWDNTVRTVWFAALSALPTTPDLLGGGEKEDGSSQEAAVACVSAAPPQAAVPSAANYPVIPDGWALVPRKPTPWMLASCAPLTQDASAADYALADEAMALLPPTEHPEAASIIADLARDYRIMVASAPYPATPDAGSGGIAATEPQALYAPPSSPPDLREQVARVILHARYGDAGEIVASLIRDNDYDWQDALVSADAIHNLYTNGEGNG